MDWIREAGASQYFPPIICELLFSRNLYDVQKELLGVSENLFTFISKNNPDGSHTNHTMWHKDNIAWISSHMLKVIQHDNNFLLKFICKFKDIVRIHKKNIVGKNLKNLKIILYMMKKAAGLMMITQPHAMEKIESEILRLLKNYPLDRPANEIMNLLTQPERLSMPTKERLVFFDMMKRFKKEKPDNSSIENHFNRYYSCFVSESAENNQKINSSWLKNKVFEELKNKSIEYFENEKASILNRNKGITKKKEAVIKQYNLGDNVLRLCNALEQFAYYRLELHLIWMVWLLQMSVLIEEKAERLGISKTVVENMRLSEFDTIKEKQDLIAHTREISDYSLDLFVIHIDEDYNYSILFEDEAKEFLNKKNINLNPPKLDYLQGNTAYGGHVFGRVKLIDESEPLDIQMKSMEDGNVLVAWQTKPNMLPAIIKAAAIVTNEGGITSHAAIIARELKKPCVMMTRWATDFFKEGDFAEVNANKGIVKKLSKEEYNKKTNVPEMIIWFKDINLKHAVKKVGGKGANLGELFNTYLVPHGFCITVNAYQEFISQNMIKNKINRLLKDIDINDLDELKSKSKKIKEIITQNKIPEALKKEILTNYNLLENKNIAIRSSGTAEDLPYASFAGQHESYLNINQDEDVLMKVKDCWASLFTTRAMIYREKNNIRHNDASMAIVIQEMIDPKYAGIMFTIDPIGKESLLLEMIEGLGDSLVSGQGNPNSYLIDRKKHEIISSKGSLNIEKRLISQISKIGMRIENHYAKPQDIELAIDKHGRIWVLQARDITTL